MDASGGRARSIEPEFLGPLGERRLAETAPRSEPDELFPGAAGFLNRRQQKTRRDRWEAAQERLARLLRPEEHVLYVAQATQTPPGLQKIGLGHMTYAYHQVMLVFTDTRLIEVLLNVWGKKPASRIRAYEWRHVQDLKLFFRSLTIKPGQGTKQSWSLQLGGDKKLVALLIPRLKTRMLVEGAGAAAPQPTWHCPKCAAANPPRPAQCGSCRTLFRSPALAACLTLAFPGAGLLYLGHPALAVMHFFVEMLLVSAAFISVAGSGSSGEGGSSFLFAGFMVLVAKLSTLSSVNILAPRTRPDLPERRPLLWKLATAGGLVSVLAFAGAGTATSRLRPHLDHDLELVGADAGWKGSHNSAEWEIFKDNKNTRSEWIHSNGVRVTVFGYPLGLDETPEQFKHDYEAAVDEKVSKLVRADETIPGDFRGFRQIRQTTDKAGRPVALLEYFLYDTDGNDVHQVLTAVPLEETAMGEELLGDFLQHARWVAPVPPQR